MIYRYKHIKPFRDHLGAKQGELASMLDLSSHTSVSTWETHENQEHELPEDIQEKLIKLMNANNYETLNTYVENMVGDEDAFQLAVTAFNKFINAQRENQIDRVALFQLGLEDAKKSISAASSLKSTDAATKEDRYVPDDVLENIVSEILRSTDEFSDKEAPLKFGTYAYIRREFVGTPFGLVVVSARAENIGAFNFSYFKHQDGMASHFRDVMKTAGITGF